MRLILNAPVVTMVVAGFFASNAVRARARAQLLQR
jgi:hypothetical protein